ncbi:hypothetical protein ACFQ8E_12700 [Isoptericola sp. NPDC056573]|uniref:hypothetical protein n=1 Tax=Isoptericola sp. NPDC056573 TaxID=3345868 RepID=UPI0036AB852C
MNAPGSPLPTMLSADATHPPLVPDALELVPADDVVVPPSHEEAILALVREVADGTAAPLWFSHETAAMLHGAWTYRTPQLVHLTREGNPHVDGEGEPSVRRHHTPMPQQDRADVRGIPVTSLARTLVDCIRALPRDGALVACDSLFRRGADPAEVSRIVSASRGKRGEAAGWMVVRVRWEELDDLAALEQRLRRAYLVARRRALLGLTA